MSTGAAEPHGIHPKLILAVLSLASVSYSILSSALIPAVTPLEHSLHSSENAVAWLLTGYLLSASVGTAIIGRLGDMYGKERLLVATLVMLSVGTLISALSTSLEVMVVGRVIQGAGGGIFPPRLRNRPRRVSRRRGRRQHRPALLDPGRRGRHRDSPRRPDHRAS